MDDREDVKMQVNLSENDFNDVCFNVYALYEFISNKLEYDLIGFKFHVESLDERIVILKESIDYDLTYAQALKQGGDPRPVIREEIKFLEDQKKIFLGKIERLNLLKGAIKEHGTEFEKKFKNRLDDHLESFMAEEDSDSEESSKE